MAAPCKSAVAMACAMLPGIPGSPDAPGGPGGKLAPSMVMVAVCSAALSRLEHASALKGPFGRWHRCWHSQRRTELYGNRLRCRQEIHLGRLLCLQAGLFESPAKLGGARARTMRTMANPTAEIETCTHS